MSGRHIGGPRADRCDALNEALHLAFQKIRSDVQNWGLDPVGVERVLATVAAFETSTVADMTIWRLTNFDIHANLAARLENARDLKQACSEAVASAARCEWLRDWLVEAENDVGAGLSAFLAPRQKAQA